METNSDSRNNLNNFFKRTHLHSRLSSPYRPLQGELCPMCPWSWNRGSSWQELRLETLITLVLMLMVWKTFSKHWLIEWLITKKLNEKQQIYQMDEHEQTDTLFDFQWPNNLDVCVFYSKSTSNFRNNTFVVAV